MPILETIAATAPVWAPAAASLAGSALDAFMVNKTNAQNLNLANTAHQREVVDLRKAGLNPMLSATGGAGAPVPEMKSPASGIQNAVNSALASRQAQANIELTQMQTRKAGVEARVMEQTEEGQLQQARGNLAIQYNDINTNKAQRAEILKRIQEIDEKIKQMNIENEFSALDKNRAKSESSYFGGVGGKIHPYLKILGAGINTATGINSLRLRTGR